MPMPPIIFVVGPSGVGKSQLSRRIETDLGFLHLDIDQRHGFHANDLRHPWDRFANHLDVIPLSATIRARLAKTHAGAVLSFPSDRVLTRQQIDTAASAGIETIVLWGQDAFCKSARRRREGRDLDEKRYDRKNRQALELYATPQFDDVRLNAFRADGSRVPLDELVGEVTKRLANTRLQPTAADAIPSRRG